MIFRAAFLLPGAEHPIRDGALRVLRGRVEEVAPMASLSARYPQEEVADLGRAVLMPGLINAHCHLELSELRPAARDFTPWLEEVVQELRSWGRERFERSVEAGLAQSLASGTTSLGDISSRYSSAGALKGAGVRGVAFREVLGLDPEGEEEALGRVMAEGEEGWRAGHRICLGISPHAPFSTSGELYRKSLALAQRFGLPLATHVGESREEVEFLSRGKGPLVELLSRLGSPVEGFKAPRLRPIEWLGELGLLRYPSLLVHVNYLSGGELALIASSSVSICFCPRSHAFFGREDHPWRELLAAGVNLCLGTDSLASNDTLSLLDELRFLREEAPGVEPRALLEMATVNGARALGLEGGVGRLRPGAAADFIALDIGGVFQGEPKEVTFSSLFDMVLEPEASVLMTVVEGETLYLRGEVPERKVAFPRHKNLFQHL